MHNNLKNNWKKNEGATLGWSTRDLDCRLSSTTKWTKPQTHRRPTGENESWVVMWQGLAQDDNLSAGIRGHARAHSGIILEYLSKKKIYIKIFLCVFWCGMPWLSWCMHGWRLEDNLWGSVLSFHHVGPGNQAQAIRLGGKHFHHAAISLVRIIMVGKDLVRGGGLCWEMAATWNTACIDTTPQAKGENKCLLDGEHGRQPTERLWQCASVAERNMWNESRSVCLINLFLKI